MLKKPKLIICDIDDTLVPKKVGMPEFTRQTLNQVHQAGIALCVASGRPLDEVQRSIREFGLDFEPEFIAGMNGGQIQDNLNHEVISQYEMEPAVLKEIVYKMKDQPCTISMYKNGMLFGTHMDEILTISAKRANKPPHIVASLDEFADAPNHKFMFRTDTPQICDEIEAFANTLQIPGVRFFKTQPNLLEVSDIRVHKGAALETICRHHDIDIQDVVAFGDASNDNDMLASAGTSVCLLNGLPDTKALADYITDLDCDHEGMAHFIQDHICISE